ncbi:MAG: tRNA pseudouridine(13) synthase TruD [bacterium]|nr:tRNA pseudouridine(13) synthase TruD [bacterium]
MSGASFKCCPEDFVVDEIALYAPSGEGGHTFLRVEKRLRTTDQVVAELARVVGVSRRDIGYAGKKDRVGVTRQWFSIPDLDPERACELELSDARVLEAMRHRNKLRTGHLRANRFEIRVRDLRSDEIVAAQSALDRIASEGFPNRFGSQRFGRQGTNAELGRDLLLGKTSLRDRRQARFLVSAMQAEVFNRVLEARPLPIGEVEAGDVAVKHESGGLFQVEDVEAENRRARAFEISPTGPIFGKKMKAPHGAPAARECAALAAQGIDDLETLSPPRGIPLAGARRALRAPVESLVHRVEGNAMHLEFTLPTGSYATVLLEEAFGPLRDGSGENRD